MNYKIYLAGPLFSRGEVRDRIEDEEKILNSFKNTNINLSIFNPIKFNREIDFDWKENPYCFFEKDYKEMLDSNVIIADIDNNDPGTILELGYFLGWKRFNKNLKIYVIYSNWKGSFVLNKFVDGAIHLEADGVCKNIDDIIALLKKDLLE